MTNTRALAIAIRRLRKSRAPSVLAAAASLVDLQRQLSDELDSGGAARVAAFQSKLPAEG
jgi:hypothetical protein